MEAGEGISIVHLFAAASCVGVCGRVLAVVGRAGAAGVGAVGLEGTAGRFAGRRGRLLAD